MFHFSTIAQTIELPATQDIHVNAMSINNVLNTGADQVRIPGNLLAKAMVYDGDVPQFAWDYGGNTGNTNFITPQIIDPDVVLTEDASFALVCYKKNGDIYLSLFALTGGNYSEITTLGGINYPHNIGDGKNANIDLWNDQFMITWESSSQSIMALGGIYSGSGVFTLGKVATVEKNKSITPDVTIYNNVVTFTYIDISLLNTNWWVSLQDDFNTILSGSANSTSNPIYHITPASKVYFGRPRISSPNDGFFDDHDFTIVIDEKNIDGNGIDIWNIKIKQIYINNFGLPILTINPTLSIKSNTEPVITYVGDWSVVSWTSYFQYPGTQTYSTEVLSRYIQSYGGGAPTTTYASIVNYDWDNTQSIPSVSGRRSGERVLYLYKNEDQNVMDMMYRTSPYAKNLRRANPSQIISCEKTNEFSFVSLQNSIEINIDKESFDFYILDISGKKIVNQMGNSGKAIVDLSNLPTGIYIIHCSSKDKETNYKFYKF